MSPAQVKVTSHSWSWNTVLRRVLTFLIAAAIIAFVLRRIAGVLESSPDPAGFTRGLLQGALMPAALPNLIVGNDVPIYALHNTGIPYKLGYTCGVNGCGAFFFGMFFWRFNRWRQRKTPS